MDKETKDALDHGFTGKKPVKKYRAMVARLNAETHRKHPEPMSLLHKRQENGDFEEGVQMAHMLRHDATLGRIEAAASAAADWFNSDPFAYGRTALHIRKGWIDPIAAEKEFRLRTIARKAAKAKEAELEKEAKQQTEG